MMSNSTKLAIFNTFRDLLDEHYHEFHGKVHSATIKNVVNGCAEVEFKVGLYALEDKTFRIKFFVGRLRS